jgi:SAM-dependent methyltransferase
MEPPRNEAIFAALNLDVALRCPRCDAGISGLRCERCGHEMRIDRRIVRALTPERVAHYAQFMRDYERIREAEGRGSEDDDYYLELPYRDATGRNSRQWQIRARTYVCLMETILAPAIPAGARILDLGAGNGWLSFRFALAGYKPVAVDLLTNDRDGLAAAGHYRKQLPALFPRFQAELASLPFQNGQFEAAIFNASFHYAENGAKAMAEALRCVKPGGKVIISDTPWYPRDDDGRQMVAERRARFLERYGTSSASLEGIEYLTDERLQALADSLAICWKTYSPKYGLRWAMRPLLANLRQGRAPARFRIYVAQKAGA